MPRSEILSHLFTWNLDKCSWITPKDLSSFHCTDISRSIAYFFTNEHESLKNQLFTWSLEPNSCRPSFSNKKKMKNAKDRQPTPIVDFC